MKLTFHDLIEKGSSLQPQDFTFSWKLYRDYRKPHFWSMHETIVYTVILKCNEITEEKDIKVIPDEAIHRMLCSPKLRDYRILVLSGKAPYVQAAIASGFSRDMTAPTFTSTSLEKIQKFLDKQTIKADVYTLLDSAVWKE